jgi:hypothetical protein
VPQLCSAQGSWQNQLPCDFVCTNGTCGGECAPGSRRCDASTGLPQLCSPAATWQNQSACPRGCQNGACIAQIGPASACTSAADCTTGFCTDGVCCQTQCNGVCHNVRPARAPASRLRRTPTALRWSAHRTNARSRAEISPQIYAERADNEGSERLQRYSVRSEYPLRRGHIRFEDLRWLGQLHPAHRHLQWRVGPPCRRWQCLLRASRR